MNCYGYLRVGAAVPRVTIADVNANVSSIEALAAQAYSKGAEILIFPELCLTAYTCADLFMQSELLSDTLSGLKRLVRSTRLWPGMAIVVGAPLKWHGALFNCAVMMADGHIKGVVPKTYIPNYSEFYEKRWFATGVDVPAGSILCLGDKEVPIGIDLLFDVHGTKVALEICEDMWTPLPPSTAAALGGAAVIANLSATNELAAKHEYLTSLLESRSAVLRCAYVYASAGVGESSTDLVYSGNAIIAENGTLLRHSPRFTASQLLEVCDVDIESLLHDRMLNNSFCDNALRNSLPDYRVITVCDHAVPDHTDFLRSVNADPFVPADADKRDARCREIVEIQTEGLMQRLRCTGMKSITVGISGGLDSTLAILVAHYAFLRLGLPSKNIIGVTMPGFGTTSRTYANAVELIKLLGATFLEISIKDAVTGHFCDIGHDINVHNLTYENSQARERTQILMDVSGQHGGMVLGTGDLSELALGWCTYNGDHMSMYGVNASVPKTLVRHLVRYFADTTELPELRRVLLDIIDTPVSPELIPATADGKISQKTEDLVGPYALHDFFIYNTLRHGFSPLKVSMLARHAFAGKYDAKTINHWLRSFYRRFFSQQFKRSCMPDGPKVGTISLSPRGDWRMPSDASAAAWLRECDKLSDE